VIVPRASRAILAAGILVLLAAGLYVVTSPWREAEGPGSDDELSFVGLTIYLIDADKADGLAEADLAAIRHVQIAPGTVQGIFGSCTLMDPPLIWKGSLLGIAQLKDGTQRRLALSKYGGFFMVVETGRWYSVGETSRASYNAVIGGLGSKSVVSTSSAP
jgi:hypothetical protein